MKDEIKKYLIWDILIRYFNTIYNVSKTLDIMKILKLIF